MPFSSNNNYQIVGVRWTYGLTGSVALIITVFLVIFISKFHSMEISVVESIAVYAATLLMAITTINLLPRTIFPPRVDLSPKGLHVKTMTNERQIPWSDYCGVLGGPAIIFKFRTKDGFTKSIKIGVWPVNIELTIANYAKSIGIDVPVRATAYNQLSPSAQIPIVFLFLTIAMIAALSGIF